MGTRMTESVVVTAFPVLFLAILFGGGALLRRRNIDMDGEPPIGRGIFYISKYTTLGHTSKPANELGGQTPGWSLRLSIAQ
jgi:hypothetical protein